MIQINDLANSIGLELQGPNCQIVLGCELCFYHYEQGVLIMPYSMGEAAKVLGLSKPTVSKYIKEGKIGATRTDDGKGYQIDPAELKRFQENYKKPSGGKPPTKTEETKTEDGDSVAVLKAKLEAAEARIADLEQREKEAREEARIANDRAHEVTMSLGQKLLTSETHRKKRFGLF